MKPIYEEGKSNMKAETTNRMNEKERLDLACWLNEKYDNLRTSISNRAAIVISADALLLASTTFLLDKILSGVTAYGKIERLLMALSAGITLVLLTLSIICAANAIATIWKSSRQMFGSDMQPSRFFHSFHITGVFKDAASFEKRFRESTTKDFLSHALNNLWLTENVFNYRYRFLSLSIKLLLAAVIPFLASVTILILKIL
jgi:hypothetical protein